MHTFIFYLKSNAMYKRLSVVLLLTGICAIVSSPTRQVVVIDDSPDYSSMEKNYNAAVTPATVIAMSDYKLDRVALNEDLAFFAAQSPIVQKPFTLFVAKGHKQSPTAMARGPTVDRTNLSPLPRDKPQRV